MSASAQLSFKVCLVNPPVLGVLEPWYDTPTFGRSALAYLAGYLRQFGGFSIQIIDAKLERLNFEQVQQRLLDFKPDLVGFTAFTNEIKPAAYQAYLLKKKLPACCTVVGGVHVTALPKETMLEFPYFDVGVVGEGEVTFYELCQAVRHNADFSGINGVVFRQNGNLVETPPRSRILDQDSIPFPAWDLMPPAETYFVQSVRGCPFNCLFCMNHNGRVARKRSVDNVMRELDWIISDFGPKRISFGDELFSVDMERTADLLDAMTGARIGDKVQWDVQTHVRYVNERLFEKFKKAGVDRVELGIETGNEESLRKMGKGTDMGMIQRACDAAKRADVKIGTFFLFGQPEETVQSLEKTVDLAVKLNPDLPMFGLMTPYPGTEVARMAAKGEGGYRLLTTDWDEYNKQIGGAMEFAGLTREQIEWFQVKAYLKVYLLNFRFVDLVEFLWEYRKAGWEVFKKIVFKRKSITGHLEKPADYGNASGGFTVETEALATSREAWKVIQQNELKRAKELSYK